MSSTENSVILEFREISKNHQDESCSEEACVLLHFVHNCFEKIDKTLEFWMKYDDSVTRERLKSILEILETETIVLDENDPTV